jgi:protein-disulfide isomerase
LLFAGGAAALIAWFPRAEAAATPVVAETAPLTDDDRSEFERWYDGLPRVDVPVPTEGAAVRIVKFNDYQCPPCRNTYFQYRQVLERYKDRPVTFVTRDFPLDPECNQTVERSFHDAACEAAVAVRLARPLGNAERLEEWLFANQQTLTSETVAKAASVVGGAKNFAEEYPKRLEEVRADIALGRTLGVQSTPTFFINNVALPPGGLPPEYFDAAVAYELRKAGK